MNKNRLVQCLLVCGGLVGGAAQAADSAVPETSEAPVLHAGGVDIYPGIGVALVGNDNIFKSDLNKKSSQITVVSPSVLMQAKSGPNVYSLSYDASLARYAQSSTDNYNDQGLSAKAELSFSERASLMFAPQFKSGHDDRGSTYATPTATPNTWDNTSVAASFIYGREESIGRIQLDAATASLRYRNNRTTTSVLDRNTSDVTGTFYYRAAPTVYTFVQLGDTRVTYPDATVTLNGNEQRILLGATWKATAQTSGSFKVGQLRKKFDSAARTSFTGSSWEGSMRWSPRDFIRVDLVSSRKTLESTGIGDYVLITSHAADAAYDLNERATLHLSAGQVSESFGRAGRSDSTPSYGLKAEYSLRKWLVLGAEYTTATKTSTGYTGASPNFRSNVFQFNLHTQL